MPVVVIRWHVVLSKNFWLARYVKLAAEHGASVTSSVIVIVPCVVSNVIARVPDAGRFLDGGVPVFVTCGFCVASAGFHWHDAPAGAAAAVDVACDGLDTASAIIPPITSTAATATPASAAVRGRPDRWTSDMYPPQAGRPLDLVQWRRPSSARREIDRQTGVRAGYLLVSTLPPRRGAGSPALAGGCGERRGFSRRCGRLRYRHGHF